MKYGQQVMGWGMLASMTLLAGTSFGQLIGDAMPQDVQNNLLLNPSFEDGFDHWSLTLGARQPGDEIRSTVEVDTSEAHSGVASLRINGGNDTTVWVAAKSDPVAVRPDTQYIISVWMKCDGISCAPGQYENSNAYVQFFDSNGDVAPVDQSPVRASPKAMGTQRWSRHYRLVMSPPNAVSAVVGAALTCTGTAWFDDIALGVSREVNWKKYETDRFIYLSDDGSTPDAAVVAANKKILESLEHVLGLRHKQKIRYYKYSNLDRKEEITGNRSAFNYKTNAIHSVRWNAIIALPGVLMADVGQSTPFLANGITSYAISAVKGTDLHKAAKTMLDHGLLQSAAALNGPAWNTVKSSPWVQTLSTSFVGYLVEKYGIEKFKKFYAFRSPDDASSGLDQRAQKVYGRSLVDLDNEWQAFLKKLP